VTRKERIHACRSTRRTVCIVKPATSRTRPRISTGYLRKVPRGQFIREC